MATEFQPPKIDRYEERSLPGRVWLLLGLIALAAAAAFFVRACCFQSDIAFLAGHAPAHWIIYPAPGSTMTHPAVPIDSVFRRSFSLPSVPAGARLRVRGFRRVVVRLNGHLVPTESTAAWKQEQRCEVAPFLRAGENELAVTVTNDRGPSALWLVLESGETPLVSDSSWEVSRAGATWLSAAPATAPIRYPEVDPFHIAERVMPSVQKVWPWWLLWAGLALPIVGLSQRWLAGSGGDEQETARRWTWLTRGLFALIAVCWTALFLHNLPYLPFRSGFDAEAHLQYIAYVQKHHSVPLADEGMQMYHPPLYYALDALLLSATGQSVESAGGALAIRLLNLALALASLALTLACLRLLFPGHPRVQILGLIFAAFLPVHLYLYQYPTNEALETTLAAAVVYWGLRILYRPRARALDYAALGVTLGAGFLAKVSTVLLIPPLALVLGARLFLDRRGERWWPAIGRVTLAGAIAFALSGWYYLRVWAHFGRPIVAATDPDLATWWQDPGYRTASDFLHWGAAFHSPLFCGLTSVWDGLYATFLADSLCGGAASLDFRPPWSYDFAVGGFVLSLLPTLAILLGAIVVGSRFIRNPSLPWAFLIALLGVTACFLLDLTLVFAANSVKSFYGLVAMVPVCALCALGLDLLPGPRRRLRTVVFALAGVWACNNFAAYWIRPNAVEVQTAAAASSLERGDAAQAISRLEQLLVQYPHHWRTRFVLSNLCAANGQNARARQLLEEDQAQGDVAAQSHLLRGLSLGAEGHANESLLEFRAGMAVAADNLDLALQYAAAKYNAGETAAAIEAMRNVLRIDPYRSDCHQALAELYARLGQEDSAREHRDYVARLAGRGQN